MMKDYKGYKIERGNNCIEITCPNGKGWCEDIMETDEYLRKVIDEDIEEQNREA